MSGRDHRVYLVGGAIRDELLGRAHFDRDYVVVGATPQDMLARWYKPVGKDFPVFLQPDTREEYALARTGLPRLQFPCGPRRVAGRRPRAPRPHHPRDGAR